MTAPLISIIVPIYNADKYISQCMDSLINQSYSNIEIICVNDGSTDLSSDLIEQVYKKDNRVTLINKENGGVSSARNLGLSKAIGEYVMFVDSDDWIDHDTCEQMIDVVDKQKVDLVIASYMRHFSNNIVKPRHIFSDEKKFNKEETMTLRKRLFGLNGKELSDPSQSDSIGSSWSKLFKRSIIFENGLQFVDLKIIGTAEDVLFNAEYFGLIDSSYYMNKCFYHYRRDNYTSITSNYKSNLPEQWKELYNRFQKMIDEENLKQAFQQALNNRISLGLIGLGLNVMGSDKTAKNKIKEIKGIITSDNYKSAINTLPFHYFPLHWKLFFSFARKGNATGVYLLLKAINIMRGK